MLCYFRDDILVLVFEILDLFLFVLLCYKNKFYFI